MLGEGLNESGSGSVSESGSSHEMTFGHDERNALAQRSMRNRGAWSLGCLAVFVAVLSSAARAGAETSASFDTKEWTLRRQIDLKLGDQLEPGQALLLRSVLPQGTSGMGDPLFGVSLIITSGDRVIDRYSPFIKDRSFHVNDDLMAMDVTGDGIPEVLFDSGFQGMSDSVHVHHVLHRPKGETSFWNIAPDQFATTRRQTFCWFPFGGRTFGLVAEPVVPAGTLDPHFCHACPHFYQYLVFTWREDRGTIVLTQVIESTREFEDGDDPLQIDIDSISSSIRSNQAMETDAKGRRGSSPSR